MIDTAIIDTAETDLDAVLCLHSLFLSPRMFDDLIAAGAGRYRFIAPEFLGQESRVDGATSRVVTMEEATEDVWRIVDRTCAALLETLRREPAA